MRYLLLLLLLVGCSGHDCTDCYDQDFYEANTYYCDQCAGEAVDEATQEEAE